MYIIPYGKRTLPSEHVTKDVMIERRGDLYPGLFSCSLNTFVYGAGCMCRHTYPQGFFRVHTLERRRQIDKPRRCPDNDGVRAPIHAGIDRHVAKASYSSENPSCFIGCRGLRFRCGFRLIVAEDGPTDIGHGGFGFIATKDAAVRAEEIDAFRTVEAPNQGGAIALIPDANLHTSVPRGRMDVCTLRGRDRQTVTSEQRSQAFRQSIASSSGSRDRHVGKNCIRGKT